MHPGPPRAGEGGGLPGDGMGEGWEAWGSGGLEAGSLASGGAARRTHVRKKAHAGHEHSSRRDPSALTVCFEGTVTV